MGRETPVLYARLLGSSWEQLAEPVRVIHTTESTVRAGGRLRITHGRSRFSRLLAWLLRLPRASEAAETRLIITPDEGGERWQRAFEDRLLDTEQYEAGERELAERFGALEFRYRLEASQGSLVFRQLDAGVLFGSFRLRLPVMCAPRVDAREDALGARHLRVHVCVAFPVLGPVLTYDGVIHLEEIRA
jgi:Domain of unknown function (DUF4166)